ncbi:MAG: CFI-box-CTERM domain-containing protein [Candidatus Hydrogenedentota bacterium]
MNRGACFAGLLMVFVSAVVAGGAWAAEAPGVSVPAPKDPAVLKAALSPIAPELVADALATNYPVFVYGDYAGKNHALAKSSADASPPQVAVNAPLGGQSGAMFSTGMQQGESWVFMCGVQSLDATAMRVQVTLDALEPGESVWMVAPQANRSFGPYTAADAVEGGRWLPTVLGEEAVVMLRSSAPDMPEVTITQYAHFYADFGTQRKLPCPLHVACVEDAAFEDATKAVGILIIPVTAGQALCSGALINNPDTVYFEPYFITAEHCFPNRVNAAQVEVRWDYLAANCDGSGVPDMDSVPQSAGRAVLARNSTLDGVLLELESVPIGHRGRTWLGWDTGVLTADADVAGIHHPANSGTGSEPMKGALGTIQQVGVNFSLGKYQTEVQWDEGITKQGSSGSPLLMGDSELKVVGMLSSGTVHDCATPEQNLDYFASLREFFPEIGCYLEGDTPCAPSSGAVCPAKAAFTEDPEALAGLRAFRDQVLAANTWGRELVDAYYRAAPTLARMVAASPANRRLFAMAAQPFAAWGRNTL